METLYTAILRKVVAKVVHATIPEGNMGYDQYTVPNTSTVAIELTFFCFPQALANIRPWPLVPFSQISLGNLSERNAPTLPFGIVACTFSDILSRNSCILQ